MNLNFQRTHLSITSFPAITLPPFTVITGPNGAGKSHFLQALSNGSISTDIATPNSPAQEIRFFDWTNLVPQDTGAFTSENLRGERQNLENTYQSLRQQTHLSEPLRAVARAHHLPQRFLDDPFTLISMTKEAWQEELKREPSPELFNEIETATKSVEAAMLSQLDPNSQSMLIGAARSRSASFLEIAPRELVNGNVPAWGRTEIFQQSFARLFVAYRDDLLSNDLAEFQAAKGYEHDAFLSRSEFSEVYGPPPWDFVNETVRNAGLDFEINGPSLGGFGPYTPQLTKLSSGAQVPFGYLSSGEKILMSFAFCVYYANDRRQLSVYPKLLLFDEIDAPLHPSMTRGLMETISQTLIRDFGVKVILATHSPSTVALAPEGSIYIMRPGEAGLHTTTKSAALNLLTVGVPTLAISYEGRRQVFVESPADGENYDLLYKLLKADIASERSLEFVATGTRSTGGSEVNTGCDVVIRLVEAVSSAGNTSIFGLVDGDGHRDSSDRVEVVGGGGSGRS